MKQKDCKIKASLHNKQSYSPARDASGDRCAAALVDLCVVEGTRQAHRPNAAQREEGVF